MSRIARVELFHVSIPLHQPFFPSWIPGYPQTDNRFTLIRLTTDDGVTGVAAGTAFAEEREGLGGLIGPYLVGMDATDIATAMQRLREASYLGWRNFWIEPAFWDLKGKIEGKPVYQLLARKPTPVAEVEVYCSTGEIRPLAERIASIEKALEMGFKTVKLRVHSFSHEEDIAVVEGVRKRFGEDLGIGVDANQGWRVTVVDDAPLWDLDRALRFSKACADQGVAWIEEPLDMHAYDNLARLRTVGPTPIAGGELNAGWPEFQVMLEKGCFDIYQPDATFAGGITTTSRLARECEAEGLGFTPHTWSNGIGFLVNLHVLASCATRTHLEYPFEPPGWTPDRRDGILASPIEVTPRGTVAVPQAPGLGIELDPKALKRWGKQFYLGTQIRVFLSTVRQKGIKTSIHLAKKKLKKK